jgi:hypothetical protein
VQNFKDIGDFRNSGKRRFYFLTLKDEDVTLDLIKSVKDGEAIVRESFTSSCFFKAVFLTYISISCSQNEDVLVWWVCTSF